MIELRLSNAIVKRQRDFGAPEGVGDECSVDDAGEVSLQASARFGGGLALASLRCRVGAGVGIAQRMDQAIVNRHG